MYTQFAIQRAKIAKRGFAFALATTALLLISATANASDGCKNVNGHYAEHAVGGPSCTSPVGLCIEGEYSGGVRGAFSGTATSLTPTADTPTTAVLLFTSDSVIHAKIKNKTGDLMIKNAGAFQSAGEGNIVDLQFITGGTGELAGATGVLRASGTFDPATGMGESEYTGMVCLP